jgi:hypothetical protein
MSTIITIRCSSLPGALDCERREAAKTFRADIERAGYVLRDPGNGIAAAVGTATHAGATWSLQQKIETGELGNKTESEQRAIDSLTIERERGVSWDDTSPDRNTAEKQVVRMLNLYRSHVAASVVPVSVEKRLQAQVSEGIILSGQTDVSELERIRDIKTGKNDQYHGAQLGGYTLLARAHNQPIDKACVDFIQRVRISQVQPNPRKIDYDMAECESLAWAVIERIKSNYEKFLQTGMADAFLPNPKSMLCSDKYCPAHSTRFCVHHTKKGDEE